LAGLAQAYQNNEVEWDGEVLTRKKNCSFPLLDLKARAKEKLLGPTVKATQRPATAKTAAAKSSKAKAASSKVAPPKPAFRVSVRGQTEVAKGATVFTKSATLKKLSGKIYPDQTIQEFLDNSKSAKALGKKIVSGGNIQLQYDAKRKLLFVLTEFGLSSRPTPAELAVLVESTTGQWSDGFGVDFCANIEEETELTVDLYPYSDDYDASKPEVTVEPW
jgi:hypothetical protein